MKKRIIRITIFVMLFFIVFSAKAANKTYTQSGVNSSYENYKSALTELKDLKCDGELYTQALVDKCNSIELQKSVSLTYLFNAKNSNKELIDSEIQKVLDSNEENCKTAVSKDLQDMINKIYLMFFIAGPILLIFFGSLDATRAIVVGDEKTRKALYTKLVKRVIALLLLFASPAIVNLLINTFGASKYSANIYTCSYTHKKITIRYTPVIRNTGNSGSSNGTGSYGASTGSTVVKISALSNERTAGNYVVVNTNYPGGIEGFQKMLENNGICQTSPKNNKKCINSENSPRGWGDCCAGFAQVQACGLKKSMELTQSNATLSQCNGAGGSLGCSGVWSTNQSTCFGTLEEYEAFVIKNIQNGVPVFTITGTSSRHFLTIVGFKEGSSSYKDFLILDSWDSHLETLGVKRKNLGKKSNISNHPCKGKSGEYWASPLKW